MNPAAAPVPLRRAVFISDVHLGSRHCHAAELADFLARLRCKRLYLVGDIVDLWWMAQRRASWGAAQNRVVEALHALRRAGTEIVYIPGNHDRPVRRFCGLALPAMRVRRRAIHVTADGRRLLVTHGDEFDAITHFGSLQEKFGDWLYYRILGGNQLLNFVRRRLGLRYWSLSEFLKRQSGAAERFIDRFVQAGLDDVRRRGLDGIVCGHIHRAALVQRDGLVYANDGDWVESLSALVEEADGSLRLLAHTGEVLAEVLPRWRPMRSPGVGTLPQAA
ncbi:UDP-2,3-diacylglucosamine diphosphatase [Thermomonas sp.]|jgi:UDP-2,3-diacylglucosamine pyrophosphatase LpxH|uniref:UDP-2,3-diacylglucosamine diphosphatase n=2 Tax=Thermomonas sp. TaxID=1971895 RepID=UPI001B54A1B9|nr:UDP-2,3-diacylglucosamine diphosphatase [Thermomonas sp.]MBK6333237.1 UDP-2,3-diacylglucosamine diphosphatase [Thermomonas sp.]MBK6923908.1 UDP-2,3-diacylglucosamine diphosphatase [Thermomonas sp.]MBK7205017.1 UDP-2,3-diacylglucosamine diphosphatase [Thermomonas sp.]MBK9670041.1 UDP-2,3-diacylglucosamine diphosphatase [Thermomonas sp.]MBL0228770.1 UDP-2,3-diacylglucosamine diphosphatase [Thermomonas sp.]